MLIVPQQRNGVLVPGYNYRHLDNNPKLYQVGLLQIRIDFPLPPSFLLQSFVKHHFIMHHFTVFTVFSLLPLTWAAPASACENYTVGQTVDTSSGPVAGHAATTAGYSEVSEYLGIPFGQPPVGALRFAAPAKFTGSSLINGSEYVGFQYLLAYSS